MGLLCSAAQLLNHCACLSKRLCAAVIRAQTVAFAIGAEASAIAEVRNTAADIAAAAARTVLAETIDAAADGALIDRSVADLPRALRVA